MNALVVFSAVVAAAQAGLINPYNLGYTGYGYNNLAYAAPYAAAAAPAYGYAAAAPAYGYAAAAPAYGYAAAPYAPSSQFQAQDEFGNLNYGYSNINSAKQEVGNAYGGVTGSYSYVDPNGELQTVAYVADARGFRVKGTNLPVAPAVPEVEPLQAPVFDLEAPVFDGVAPEPVEDTPEVAAARAEFLAAFEKEASRHRRSDDTPADTQRLEVAEKKVLPALPLAYTAAPYAAYGLNYGLPYARSFGYPYGYARSFGYPYGYAGLGYGLNYGRLY